MKYYFLAVAFMCAGVGFSQSSTNQTASKRTKTVAPIAPKLTPEMEIYASKNGSYIVDISEAGGKEIVFDGEISMEKAQLIDPKKMGLSITGSGQVYQIIGTSKLLYVKSTWVLESELKNNEK